MKISAPCEVCSALPAPGDLSHELAEHLNIRYGEGYTVWNRYTKAVSKP